MSVSRYIPAPLADPVYAGDMGDTPNSATWPTNRKSLRIQVFATLKDSAGNARRVSAKRTLKRKR